MSNKRKKYIIAGSISSAILIVIIFILGISLSENSRDNKTHQNNKKLSIEIKDKIDDDLIYISGNTYTTVEVSNDNTLYLKINKPADVTVSADRNIKITKHKVGKLKYKISASVPNTDSSDGKGNVNIEVNDGNTKIKRKIYLVSPKFDNMENPKESSSSDSESSSSKEESQTQEVSNSSDDTKVKKSSEPSEPDYADKLQDEIVGSGSCTNISFSKDEDKNYIINVTGYEGWNNYNNEQLNYKIQNVVERMNVIVNREATYMPAVNFFLPNGKKVAYTEFNDIDHIYVINKD